MLHNVCDFCERSIEPVSSGFDVETGSIVKRYHYVCGQQIHMALLKSHEAGGRSYETSAPDRWEHREFQERLDAAEAQILKVTSVWRLWLNDARRGSINPATFDAMRTLLGME